MSLYLKYRPQKFSDIEGQKFIKETLKKAIKDDKTVGAYLFTGPRGTGKTSTARILAKALNCENSNEGEPCLKCNNCESITIGNLIDVIEIDAASNTGVDNIREIIERAQFMPNKSKYKIYIIDEVHMLSKGAFNALLKTLEEPPNHVKFILATTEIHKVPDTIISRCQRFDFGNISPEDIRNRLDMIAKSEKVKIDDKSIDFIIKNSHGGLRNAISLFEQYITDKEISYDNIVSNFGLVDQDKIEEFWEKLVSKDITLMSDYENMLSSGMNIKLFFKEILYLSKNQIILSMKHGGDISRIFHISEILLEALSKSRNTFDEKILFLLAITKIIGDISSSEGSQSMTQSHQKQTNSSMLKSSSKSAKLADKNLHQPKKNPPKTTEIKSKEEIGLDDISSVFHTQENNSTKEKLSIINNGSFDINSLIEEVKKEKGKAFLSMGLKSSKYEIIGDKLNITPNNKFNYDKMSTPENIGLINEKLSILGVGYQVKVNI